MPQRLPRPCRAGPVGSALGVELQCGAVHAVAQAGGAGAVGEDVAEVAAAAGAVDLRARHLEAAVLLEADGGLVDGGGEGRPAGAAVELGVGGEEGDVAAGAEEAAGAVLAVERAGAGALGAVAAERAELLGGEALLPAGLVVADGKAGGGAAGFERPNMPIVTLPSRRPRSGAFSQEDGGEGRRTPGSGGGRQAGVARRW